MSITHISTTTIWPWIVGNYFGYKKKSHNIPKVKTTTQQTTQTIQIFNMYIFLFDFAKQFPFFYHHNHHHHHEMGNVSLLCLYPSNVCKNHHQHHHPLSFVNIIRIKSARNFYFFLLQSVCDGVGDCCKRPFYICVAVSPSGMCELVQLQVQYSHWL